MKKTYNLRREEIQSQNDSEYKYKSSPIGRKHNRSIARGFEKDLKREKMFMPRFPSAKSDYGEREDDGASSPESRVDLRKKKNVVRKIDDGLPNQMQAAEDMLHKMKEYSGQIKQIVEEIK